MRDTYIHDLIVDYRFRHRRPIAAAACIWITVDPDNRRHPELKVEGVIGRSTSRAVNSRFNVTLFSLITVNHSEVVRFTH